MLRLIDFAPVLGAVKAGAAAGDGVILDWLESLVKLNAQIACHDRDLAKQLKRSSSSVALNCAGWRRAPNDRRACDSRPPSGRAVSCPGVRSTL